MACAQAQQKLKIAQEQQEAERMRMQLALDEATSHTANAGELTRLRGEAGSWKEQTRQWADAGTQLQALLTQRDDELNQVKSQLQTCSRQIIVLQAQLAGVWECSEKAVAAAEAAAEAAEMRWRKVGEEAEELRHLYEQARQALLGKLVWQV